MSGFLQAELTTAALCWRVERRDGICIGFTTHDRDLEHHGVIYRAAPGMLPSAISLSDGLDAEALEVSGALTSDAIGAGDLRDGRWDGAEIAIFMLDWEAADGAALPLARGQIGDVSVAGGGFSAELRGAAALLDRPVVELTSPECRAELGDKRCRVDMAGRVRVTRVAELLAEDRLRVGDASPGPNAYGYGRLRWLTGRNSGLYSEILSSEETALRLREAPPHAAAVGDLVEISEGCDKMFATCCDRFTNSANFRGEPYLPGNDLLTRYAAG
jgi:uncharacterized phage protein (TIGR02218 family)